jgi:Pro-kumamolisin, activation domain/Bacterial Ig-like domain (group 3)
LRKLCSILSAPFLLVLVLSALPQGSQAQTALKDRITEAIESSNITPMAGTVHPLAKPEFDQGLADNAKVLEGMTLNFQRSAAQEASLQALLQAQQDPASASYHKWLTPAQFGQQFGMSSADVVKASAWLQQEGFTVTAVSQSSNSISFSGSIATAERAFQTQIHNYTVNGEKHFANSTPISIPSALAGTVSSVRGLNDFRLKPRLQFPKGRSAGTTAHFTSGVSGSHYLTPGDFATIYDVTPLYSSNTGKGITIAVIGQTDIVPADITDFRAAAGLSVNNPTVVTVPGSTPSSVAAGAASNDLAETDLDLEWSGGVATGASIVLVNSADVFTSLQYAIQNTINGITIPIISQSYGDCEAGYQTSDLTTIEGYLAQANSQGQTVILAAGDTGAADCDDSTSPTNPIQSATLGLAVDYPGSSVYVTDLGGSEFMGDGTATSPQTGSGTYWNSSGTGGVSDDLVSSAKSYIPEMAWNDTTVSISQGGGLSAGGGGVSSLWKKPTWQAGVPGIPADGFRDVPDISLAAAVYHDGLLYCTQVQTATSGSAYVSSCQANSFRISDTGQTDDSGLQVAGGTSFAAPSFAGLLAIIEQKLASGGGLGNINPSIYALAANSATYATAFHDITSGNNQVPCTAGSPNCGTTGTTNVIGYTAATGYDQATGLGSVDANVFATAYAALVTATGTKTTLVAAPGTSLESGEKVTFTATVAPNTLSTAPTGTVTFTVDGTAETPVTLSTAAPYTAALVETNGLTTGTHTVVATYTSGDATYTGSTSSTLTVTVVSSGTAATTTVVTASPTTFALGGPVTLSAVITGTTAGTLTGPLTFSTGGVTIGSVKQVTIGTGNTATATLSVSAATASLGFAAGTDTITATYGGDIYNAVSSGTTTVTVTNPGITLSATNITISSASPGSSGTSTVTLTSTGSYAGTAVVSASASSLDADYQFGTSGAQTASVVLASGGTGTTTIEITTIAAGSLQKSKGNLRKTAGRIAAAGGTAAGCLLLLLIPGIRRKRWPVALAMLVFLSVGAGLGCGGGTGGASPTGTYTVTLTAADSSNANITGTTTFTVTIQ